MDNSDFFSPVKIIAKKRDGHELTSQEIRWFIEGFTKGPISSAQMGAFLMAIYLKKLTESEKVALTDAMLYSGTILEFSDPSIIDKHSTGGVGDKATFLLAPIAHACGIKIPMVAGRGLGHTGGTVDKIEAIENFQTKLSLEEFSTSLKKYGMVLMGQTEDIAPADKKIYALRDVTATVESIELITASIMSKKLAEGAAGYVFDVKTGQGAFMPTLESSRALALSLCETAKRFSRKAAYVISDMNSPLGHAIGHSLELMEIFEALKGKGPKDLEDLSLTLAAKMIVLGQKATNEAMALEMAKEALYSGKALQSFRELLERQGANSSIIDFPEKLPIAPIKTLFHAPKDGYVSFIDTKALGLFLVDLGGGRKTPQDTIDFGVGLRFFPKIGSKISKDDCVLEVYSRKGQEHLLQYLEKNLWSNFLLLSSSPTKSNPLIWESL